MDVMCPVCNKLMTLREYGPDPSKLAGYCGHWPGMPERVMTLIPNPEYQPPAVKETEAKSKRSKKA